MLERILVVEDERNWIENYTRWLVGRKELGGAVDFASTAAEAMGHLKRKWYAVAIVDLVLYGPDAADRSGNEVQQFLHTKVEGTAHIVVSGRAEKDDVRDAAFRFGATAVLFKWELDDPSALINAVAKAFEDSRNKRPDFVKTAARSLLGRGENGELLESKVIHTLRSGAAAWQEAWRNALARIVPVACHSIRSLLDVRGETVAGLCWSRNTGAAVTFCFAHSGVSSERQRGEHAEWLGFNPGEPSWDKGNSRIRTLMWDLPEIGSEQFDLDANIPR